MGSGIEYDGEAHGALRGLRDAGMLTPVGERVLADMDAAHKAETAALVAERGTTHGNWADNAAAAQDLKRMVFLHSQRRAARGQAPLTDKQTESLEMICHKMGRILAGDASFPDHWDDIAGYAKIANGPR